MGAFTRLRTSLFLLQQAGSTVVDRGDHVLLSTADNAGFWWGTFLLFRRPPSAEQARIRVAQFEEELPWAAHRAFGLDDPSPPDDALSTLADLGYEVELSTVMTTGSPAQHRASGPGGRLSPVGGRQ